MNKFLYQWMYRLGQSHWDTGKIPSEVIEAIQSGRIPPGPALDLGCGTGTSVIYMAQHGRLAIGVDFVPSAISKARIKAQQAGVSSSTQFFVGDVTRLNALALPQCAFALDMGCFHGLNPDGQRGYVEGLSALLQPGGQFMLYTLNPRKEAGFAFGMSPEQVQSVFAESFDITRIERGSFWGDRSTWFWMERKTNPRF